MPQPPKRKPPAPVDTVRLKKDIAADAAKLASRAKVAGQLDAAGKKPQGNAVMQGSMDDMQRIVARQKTLETTRAGQPKRPVNRTPEGAPIHPEDPE